MKAWPLVCITAWANSCVRAEIRARISMQTTARVSGPASRQAAMPARIAGSSTSGSACGYSTPSSGPYGDTSPPVQPSVPGWSSSKRVPRSASNAASPSAGAVSP